MFRRCVAPAFGVALLLVMGSVAQVQAFELLDRIFLSGNCCGEASCCGNPVGCNAAPSCCAPCKQHCCKERCHKSRCCKPKCCAPACEAPAPSCCGAEAACCGKPHCCKQHCCKERCHKSRCCKQRCCAPACEAPAPSCCGAEAACCGAPKCCKPKFCLPSLNLHKLFACHKSCCGCNAAPSCGCGGGSMDMEPTLEPEQAPPAPTAETAWAE